MPHYKILYSKKSVKFLKRIPKEDSERITKKIELLGENPFPPETKKVQGLNDIFRLRVGDYRILYNIDKKEKILGIIKIDKRSRVYKNL